MSVANPARSEGSVLCEAKPAALLHMRSSVPRERIDPSEVLRNEEPTRELGVLAEPSEAKKGTLRRSARNEHDWGVSHRARRAPSQTRTTESEAFARRFRASEASPFGIDEGEAACCRSGGENLPRIGLQLSRVRRMRTRLSCSPTWLTIVLAANEVSPRGSGEQSSPQSCVARS